MNQSTNYELKHELKISGHDICCLWGVLGRQWSAQCRGGHCPGPKPNGRVGKEILTRQADIRSGTLSFRFLQKLPSELTFCARISVIVLLARTPLRASDPLQKRHRTQVDTNTGVRPLQFTGTLPGELCVEIVIQNVRLLCNI
jgi:hypothetical protein